MTPGYCFLYDHGPENHHLYEWWCSLDEKWDMEIYSPTGAETLIGTRRINDTLCNVWQCPDGNYRAQTALP